MSIIDRPASTGAPAPPARIRRVVVAAALIVLSTLGGPETADADDTPATDESAVHSGVVGPADDLTRLDWAHARYRAAGLAVPEVDIEFHDADQPCEGNLGTLRRQADGSRIVRICADHDDPEVRDSWRRKTVVHELAHVWEVRNVSDEVRVEFMELRGLDNWNDRDARWHSRAIEHAAEVITWGIGDPAWRFDVLPTSSCDEMAAAYELLIGRTAPRVAAQPCA